MLQDSIRFDIIVLDSNIMIISYHLIVILYLLTNFIDLNTDKLFNVTR